MVNQNQFTHIQIITDLAKVKDKIVAEIAALALHVLTIKIIKILIDKTITIEKHLLIRMGILHLLSLNKMMLL